MSNSKLVSYTRLSPNHSGKRTHTIDRITPHCVVGQMTAESIAACFASTARQASCNYGIGKDGKIALIVDEGNRSWCTSSNSNDQRAVTIECASDAYHPYKMNSKVYNSLVALCVDICKRNGKKRLISFGSQSAALAYIPQPHEMVLTAHRWFANKECPGLWLYSRYDQLAKDVNKQLDDNAKSLYKVEITAKRLPVKAKPRATSKTIMYVYKGGCFTIVQESAKKSWGKLKSGAGWIVLKRTKRI